MRQKDELCKRFKYYFRIMSRQLYVEGTEMLFLSRQTNRRKFTTNLLIIHLPVTVVTAICSRLHWCRGRWVEMTQEQTKNVLGYLCIRMFDFDIQQNLAYLLLYFISTYYLEQIVNSELCPLGSAKKHRLRRTHAVQTFVIFSS